MTRIAPASAVLPHPCPECGAKMYRTDPAYGNWEACVNEDCGYEQKFLWKVTECPAVGQGGGHSPSYDEEGEACEWCGTRSPVTENSGGADE